MGCFNTFKKQVSRFKKCRKVQKFRFVIFQMLENVFKKNVSKVSGLPQFRKLYKFQSVIKLLKHGKLRDSRCFNTFLIFSSVISCRKVLICQCFRLQKCQKSHISSSSCCRKFEKYCMFPKHFSSSQDIKTQKFQICLDLESFRSVEKKRKFRN